MACLLSGILLLSVLIQGGFYPTVFLLAGIFAAVCLLFRRHISAVSSEHFLWAVSVVYLFSSVFHGYDSRGLAQACLPGVNALFLRLYCGLSANQRRRFREYILAGGIALAGLAILAYSGVFPLKGSVISNRLQFTFQYANAAGSWFAAISLLLQESDNKRLRSLMVFPIMALFLTGSVGAIGIYAALQVVRLCRKYKKSFIVETLLIHTVSIALALGIYWASSWISILLLVLLYLAGRWKDKLLSAAIRIWPVIIIAFFVAAVFASVGLYPRYFASTRTFVERLIQVMDGMKIIAHNPVLGIGAGNWAVAYPYYQTAQYTSAVIHSSIIQIGVDAGLPAMLLAVLFVITAWRQGKRDFSENLACILLIVHSLMDFTLLFFPISALLMTLLFSHCENEKNSFVLSSCGKPAFLCSLVLCGILFAGEMQYKKLMQTARTQDWAAVVSQYENKRVLWGENTEAKNIYLYALYEISCPEKILNMYKGNSCQTLDSILLTAKAHYLRNNKDFACKLLLSELEKQPFRVALYEQTANLFQEWKADTRYIEHYNNLANHANNRRSYLGVLKGDQVFIKQI